MHVGYSAIFQNPGNRLSDTEIYREEIRLAELAEPLGFDSVWSVEHHFTEYTMCPDVVQFLSYLAGRTRRVRLGSMVVVLPWHDPIRIAEQISLLDHYSGGRMILGLGRGLGRVEYEGFRIDMNEARGRFVETTEMLVESLETGVMERDGQYVKQPAREIRPRPLESFRGRTYAAAISPESLPLMARLGIGILIVPQKPWRAVAADMRRYNDLYREHNGCEAPPPIVAGWTFVDENEDRAQEMGRDVIRRYYESAIQHYEFESDHLAKTEGYEFYASGFQAKIQELGKDGVIDFLTSLAVFGTPEQVYERILHFRELTGMNGYLGIFSFAGMNWPEAERNMRCFASRVTPELRKLETEPLRLAKSA